MGKVGERRGDARIYMNLSLLWYEDDVKGGQAVCNHVFPDLHPPVYYKNSASQTLGVMCLPAKVQDSGVCLCGHLEEELRKLREETNVDSLRQELDRERSKRLELEQKMNEVVKSR